MSADFSNVLYQIRCNKGFLSDMFASINDPLGNGIKTTNITHPSLVD